MNGIPDSDPSKENIIYMMMNRMKQLKGDIVGCNVLSFDLSQELDEEETLDMEQALKYADELVVFDHQLSSSEIIPIIQERLRNFGSTTFFGEPDDPGIKEVMSKNPNTRATQYPAKMIEMMWMVKSA